MSFLHFLLYLTTVTDQVTNQQIKHDTPTPGISEFNRGLYVNFYEICIFVV